MKKEDCKLGLKIVWVDPDGNNIYGTIMDKECHYKNGDGVWVLWDSTNGFYDKNAGYEAWIDCDLIRTNQLFSIEEINAMLDEIELYSDADSLGEWYASDRTFTKYGLDKLRDCLKEKQQKLTLKEQAMAKLTASLTKEEIEALGIK